MPKLDATHIAERLRSRLAELEAGAEVAAKDIRALLTPEQITAMEAAWAEQQTLRKIKRAKTVEEQQRMGWKSKREVYIEAYRQAIAASDETMLDDLRRMQREAEIRRAKIYMRTFSEARKELRSFNQADSMANNEVARAGLQSYDGANHGAMRQTKRDREIERLEEAIKAEILKNMTPEELEQQVLKEEYEKNRNHVKR